MPRASGRAPPISVAVPLPPKAKSHSFATSNPKRQAKIPLTPVHSPEARPRDGRTQAQRRGRRGRAKAEKNPSLRRPLDPHLFRAPTPLPPEAFLLRSNLLGGVGGKRVVVVVVRPCWVHAGGRGAPESRAAMALPVAFVRLSLLLLVALPFCAPHPGHGFHAPREFQSPALHSGSCPPHLACLVFLFFLLFLSLVPGSLQRKIKSLLVLLIQCDFTLISLHLYASCFFPNYEENLEHLV